MISEYIDHIQRRINAAIREGDEDSITHLAKLLNMVIEDGAISGEVMPWDKACPLCGSPAPATALRAAQSASTSEGVKDA